jgi:DNA-binding transcriptional regulator YdaS (Cro superfamily)
MESSSYIIDPKITGLDLAKRAAEQKTGLKGNTALAKALDGAVSPQAISQWDRVPLGRVFDIERATGVSRHELRPDFFGEGDAA